jgi:hypothetical protein
MPVLRAIYDEVIMTGIGRFMRLITNKLYIFALMPGGTGAQNYQ